MYTFIFNGEKTKRIDSFVVEKLPRLSRSFVQKLCQQGKVLVNGVPAAPSHKLKVNEAVTLKYDLRELDEVTTINFSIIYEDDDSVVINKPIGILTHSKGALNPEATVATWLRSRLVGLEGERAGIVHRLDRATSGVMICAKNSKALSWLQKQFSQRKVKKSYVAIVLGQVTPTEAIIDMPIERNPKAPATFRVGANGKQAKTHYKVVKSNQKYSMVLLTPETGRTHQLRVHLKHLGHPIVGDTLYDGPQAARLFLHALSLEITLPNRRRQVFEVPFPKEFKEYVE